MNKFYSGGMPHDVTASIPEQAPGLRIVSAIPLRVRPSLLVVDADSLPPEVEWSVGAVSEQCGIPTATLRSWDRRYGIGPSQRTSGAHRRYSGQDICRVQMVRQLTDRGVPTQTAARVALSMDAGRLVRETAAPSA